MKEDNKLIADFMGLSMETTSSGTPNYEHKGFWYGLHELQYHLSWNWLMPVVKRIVRDVELDVGYEDEYREHLMDVVPFAKIEDVHEAVVQFIKNQNT
tara:strand:- start:1778 stop:2071 length:294 start_codon:yes stop_codon:yes gene_type:complete